MERISQGGNLVYDTKPKDGQSELSYLWSIGQAKDNGEYDGTWEDIGYLLNFYYRDDESEYRTSSAYRKPYEQAKKFYECGVFNSFSEDEYVRRLNDSKRELEREKIKYRDERRAWSKQNYVDARAEDVLDKIESSLSEVSRVNFPNVAHPVFSSDNDMIVLLSDLHIGATFNNRFGRYSTDIAKERMAELLHNVLAIQATHNSEACYVLSLGDQISGLIHKTVQVTNRENVIDQVKIATELISSFCYELTRVFDHVHFVSVSGNHSRLTTNKDNAIHDDRLDDIVAWGVGLSLAHVDNFYTCANIDTSIALFDIRGKTYVATHGDYDGFTKGDTHRLISMIHEFPEAWFCGHLHTIAVDEVNEVKMIRGGSLAGSGDDYTVERRLSGKASQLVCLVNNEGLLAYYPIYLN